MNNLLSQYPAPINTIRLSPFPYGIRSTLKATSGPLVIRCDTQLFNRNLFNIFVSHINIYVYTFPLNLHNYIPDVGTILIVNIL